MATQTLAVAANYINNEIIKGVAEDIITVNPIFASLPFSSYTGQAEVVNVEPSNIDVLISTASTTTDLSAGAGVTYKAATAAPTQRTFSATKLIGDVEMDKLVQAQSQSAGVDQLAFEISAKAKSIARNYQIGMATGSGTAPAMNSFHSQNDPTQQTAATADNAGQAISFQLLDELLDLVLAKDGEVDFIMMAPRTFRSYKTLLRTLGGTTADWQVSLPDGRTTIGYENIPIFKNGYLSVDETQNGGALTGGGAANTLGGVAPAGTGLTSVWAGVFDDGSKKVGISGIYPEGTDVGISVEPIGAQENRDAEIWRVKQYTNFVSFNAKGLARLTSIGN